MNTAGTIRRGMTVMAVAALCALIAMPAYAAYEDSLKGYWKMDDMSYDDNFSDTSRGSQWVDLYNMSYISEGGGVMNVDINNTGTVSARGGYASAGSLDNDFDVEVNFSNFTQSGSSFSLARLLYYVDSTNYIEIRRSKKPTANTLYVESLVGGSLATNTFNTAVTSGTLRLTREGATAKAYYDIGGGDQLLQTRTSFSTSSGYIWLYGQAEAYTNSSFDLDDFTVTNGEKAMDAKGTNTGTIYGATQTTGKTGLENALSFNGTSDYVSVSNDSSLNITGDMTVSAWVKFDDSYRSFILGKGSSCNDNTFFLGTGSSSVLLFGAGDGSSYDHVAATVVEAEGVWRHVVGVRDGTKYTLYLDGVYNNERIITLAPSSNSSPLTIGKWYGTDTAYNFDGSLDDTAIWSRALDANEIDMLYDLGTEKFEWLTLGVNDSEELNLGYTTSELKLMAELYAEGNVGASEIIDGVTWRYLSGDLPGDIGGTTYDYGDTWTYEGRSYIKLGSGLEGSPVPEPGCAFGLLVGFFVPGFRRLLKRKV